jgi:hypothetical protein
MVGSNSGFLTFSARQTCVLRRDQSTGYDRRHSPLAASRRSTCSLLKMHHPDFEGN